MHWYFFVAYFFGGAFLVDAVPHFVQGVSGRSFPTPFASPPGKWLSSPFDSTVTTNRVTDDDVGTLVNPGSIGGITPASGFAERAAQFGERVRELSRSQTLFSRVR